MTAETQIRTPRQKYPDEHPLGQMMPFERITEPGAYICNWSGHLLRVPDEAMSTAGSPMIDIVGTGGMFVTKISEDPYVPVTKARLLAADHDVAANF